MGILTSISTAFHKGGWGMWPILITSIFTIADRIAFLDGGRILEMGPPAEILSSPREARTRQFLQRILDPI